MKESKSETEKRAETGVDAAPGGTAVADAAMPSADELSELKKKATQADEHWERVLRTTADFDNYKKRAAREKQDAIKYANESLLEKLIPVLDAFEMALAATQSNGTG